MSLVPGSQQGPAWAGLLGWLATGSRVLASLGTATGTWPAGLQSGPHAHGLCGQCWGEGAPQGSGLGWVLGKHSGHIAGCHE